jgi:hypothetical protein
VTRTWPLVGRRDELARIADARRPVGAPGPFVSFYRARVPLERWGLVSG